MLIAFGNRMADHTSHSTGFDSSEIAINSYNDTAITEHVAEDLTTAFDQKKKTDVN